MKNRGGFTIIETLIVLAVSGAMFTVVAVFFSGRQDRVEFAQGVRDIDSRMRDVINDVRNGYYINPNQSCSTSSGSISFNRDIPSVQGTNSDCIFAGKVLFFNNESSANKLTSYALAGYKSAETFNALKPALMGFNGNETAEEYLLPAGIRLVNNDKQPVRGALALLFDINGINLAGGAINVAPFKLKVSDTISNAVRNMFIDPVTTGSIDNSGLTLCFSSGNNDQFAVINLKRAVDGISSEVLIDQNINSVSCWDGVTL